MVEEGDEGAGGGVGAGDDDPEGVAVEPAAVGFEGVVLARCVDEPGGDVLVSAVVFPVDAFAHLRVGPYEHGLPAGRYAGDAEADSCEPGRGREEAEKGHAVVHQVDGEMTLPRCEHVEGLAEGELAHEVEGEVVEPGCHIQWSTQTLGYRRREKRGVMVYLWFVLIKCFGAEAMVPDAATLVVKCLVAGGDDGGSGEEEVVEGCFGAFTARAVDFDHCRGRTD